MKTYKDEYSLLAIWLQEQLDEARKLPKGGVGFDTGQQAQQKRKVDIEYRRRLRDLRAKHGMPADF